MLDETDARWVVSLILALGLYAASGCGFLDEPPDRPNRDSTPGMGLSGKGRGGCGLGSHAAIGCGGGNGYGYGSVDRGGDSAPGPDRALSSSRPAAARTILLVRYGFVTPRVETERDDDEDEDND